MTRIVILGTPVSSGNRGVLALGSSLVGLFLRADPGAEITLLLGHRTFDRLPYRVDGNTYQVAIVPCRLSPRSRPRDHLVWILAASLLYRLLPAGGIRAWIVRSTPWIAAIERADLVGDIRGGDSFSDIYGLRRFLLGFAMIWTVLLVKGSIVQLPQTFGPYQSCIARQLARYILRRSPTILARDRTSQTVAQGLVGSGRRVDLCPDVAFSLQALPPAEIVLDPPLAGAVVDGVIGINVNGLMYNGGYTRGNMFGLKLDYAALLPALIAALARETAGEFWLVPHTYEHDGNVESDPEACRKVRDALPAELRARVRLVAREYDQHEIKAVIGRCDFFVGSRMHACIAALSQGIPCVGIAYSRKFAGVFETVGMEDWVIDGRQTGNEEALRMIIELFRQRAAKTQKLVAKSQDASMQLRAQFAWLFRASSAHTSAQTAEKSAART